MKYSEKLPTAEQFFEIFETTGWNTKYELTKEELFTALKNSWHNISVCAKDKTGFYEKLGFKSRAEHSPEMELEKYW